MSDRKMNILELDKEEVRSHLTCRAYGEIESKWLDDNWDTLCDYAENSDELSKYFFANGLKNHIASKISRETGKDSYQCYIQEIMWFAVNQMQKWKGLGPDGEDLFFVETNPIPKSEMPEHLCNEEIWELHLRMLFEEQEKGFQYNPGSVSMDDKVDSYIIHFEIY